MVPSIYVISNVYVSLISNLSNFSQYLCIFSICLSLFKNQYFILLQSKPDHIYINLCVFGEVGRIPENQDKN